MGESDENTETPFEARRREAIEIAEDKEFDTDDMLFCVECGNTALRSQKTGNPGFKDKIFCTCSEIGYPMIPVEQ